MKQHRLMIALLVSVALNFGLAGILVGDHFFGRANALAGAPLKRVVETLPADSRPAVREALREHRFELARALRELKKNRRRVQDLVQREQASSKDLERAFADVRGATEELQRILHGAMVEGLSGGS